MTPLQLALRRKLEHARFFLERLQRERDDPLARECYFAAFLSSIRAIPLYIRGEREKQKGKLSSKEWSNLIDPWEADLRQREPEKADKWKFLHESRNKDHHEYPITLDSEIIIASGFGAAPYGMQPFGGSIEMENLTIEHPTNPGLRFELFDACIAGLDVAYQMMRDEDKII